MEIICTRPSCGVSNHFSDLDDPQALKTTQQKYCTQCGMPLILGGRYLPSKLLGKGGFGAAFLARDRYTTKLRECVVKIFQPAGDLSPEQLEIAQNLFEREAAVLEDIGNHHPQVPDSYAFFPLIARDRALNKDTQFFYLVQEFIDGQDLDHERVQKGVYAEAEVLEVLREVLGILEFVHQKGVIHRDIKPSNIMRSRQGTLYLLDFGAVKQVTTGAGGAAQGRSTGIYSLGFAPPEQMQGSQVYPSTDLYALAATCLVLLTGKAPDELFDAYHNQWAWRDQAPQVSDRLAVILDKMLQATPKNRFQSAQEVLTLLDRALPATPAAAPPSPRSSGQSTTLQRAAAASAKAPVRRPQPKPQPPTPAATAHFTTVDLLSSAAFTGFEGTLLLSICLGLGGGIIFFGLWGIAIAGIVYSQIRRTVQGNKVFLLAILTFIVALFIPIDSSSAIAFIVDQIGLGKPIGIGFLGILGGAIAVMITALFRLIYQILLSIL